jgi:hypothetical protein
MSARSIFPGPLQTRNIVRFPARRTSCVWVLREDTAWLISAALLIGTLRFSASQQASLRAV